MLELGSIPDSDNQEINEFFERLPIIWQTVKNDFAQLPKKLLDGEIQTLELIYEEMICSYDDQVDI